MRIRLSRQHGVNPSLDMCFVCGEDTGTIVLPGQLPGDAQAPSRAVWSHEPCQDCLALMKQGVFLVSVRDGETGNNPYRTGRIAVVTDDAIRRIITSLSLQDSILQQRVAFVPDTVWDALGLPSVDVAVAG